ncbi:MAG: NrsF family protein [Vicinamibacterales bacterium]
MIATLVRDLQPVRPLPLPQVRLAQWGLVVVATMAVVTAWIGPRADLQASLATLPLHAHFGLLVVVAVSSAIAALAMAIPGERVQPWRRRAPVVAGLAWATWLFVELWVFAANGKSLSPGVEGVGCVAKAFTFAVTPGIALTLMLGRGLASDTRTMMVFAGLATAAVGALGVELTCPMTSPSHVLVWHGGPVVVAAMAAWVIGRAMLEKVTLVRLRPR